MDLSLILIIVFSVIGVVDASYLSYHAIKKTDVACVMFPKEWCYKVQHSKQSKMFGIPNAYLGLLMYVGILILMFAYLSLGIVPFLFIQIVIGIGFLFSMYFLFVQAFVLRAFCTWCVVSAVNFTVMAIAAFLL